MAELPADRCEESAPFTYSALLRKRRSKGPQEIWVSVYMSCIAGSSYRSSTFPHTDSFIHALRRFTSVRGQVRMLRSDRGTNFIGTKRELEECVELVKSNVVKGSF